MAIPPRKVKSQVSLTPEESALIKSALPGVPLAIAIRSAALAWAKQAIKPQPLQEDLSND